MLIFFCDQRIGMNYKPDTTGRNGFGPRVRVRGQGADSGLLTDIQHIYRVLGELPEKVGVSQLQPPFAFKSRYNNPEGPDYSGEVSTLVPGIQRSRIGAIYVYTYSDSQRLVVDVDGWQHFDSNAVLPYLRERFGVRGRMDVSNVYGEMDMRAPHRAKKRH